jgi:hypothetical protein
MVKNISFMGDANTIDPRQGMIFAPSSGADQLDLSRLEYSATQPLCKGCKART